MRRVTVLLWGVPQYVTLSDLSYNLDRLFNTDEIGTFKIRDLPNHRLTYKRQIALDFRSGFDAMAAQEKLDGYKYELINGREYTLHAKINKEEEYMRSESPSPERNRWDVQDSWSALGMIPNVSDGDLSRAHAKLDAQLELLKKQKLLIATEAEILREKRRLKREYGYMDEHDSENEAITLKRFKSREHWSRHRRSRSREVTNGSGEHKSRSQDHVSKLPELEWHHEERASSAQRSHSRERCSRPREIRSRYHRSRSRDSTDRSRISPRDREGSSRSAKDWIHRDRRTRSREREHRRRRSRSDEQSIIIRRSGSRERVTNANDTRDFSSEEVVRTNGNHRRSRTPERSSQLAIMSKSTEHDRTPSKGPLDAQEDAHTPPIENITIYIDVIKNKDGINKVQSNGGQTNNDNASSLKNNSHDDKATETKINKKDNSKELKEKAEKRKIKKYNNKINKVMKLEARVKAISKDLMNEMLVLLDEIIKKDNITITEINKKLIDKRLESLVQERVEPLARMKNNTDDEALKKYKILYAEQDDIAMLKMMLDDFPKVDLPQATVTSAEATKDTADFVAAADNSSYQQKSNTSRNQESKSNEQEQCLSAANKGGQKSIEIIDMFSNSPCKPTNNSNKKYTLNPYEIEPTHKNDKTEINIVPSENNKENLTENKQTVKNEMDQEIITIIDLDSAEKPIPRRPMFVLVLKSLTTDMLKVIKNNKLEGDIKVADLKHVLRYILRDLLRGQGYMTRAQILHHFRGVYPKHKDAQFVQNAIKDIKNGKYPGLLPGSVLGSIVESTENDCEDDVILIEKQYDVVTVADSDDEEVVKMPIETVDLECGPAHLTTQDKSGSSTTILANTVPVTFNLANPTLADFGPVKSNPSNPSVDKPGLTKPVLANPVLARRVLENSSRGLDMPSLYDGIDMPGLANPGVANPSLAKPGLVNPGPINTSLAKPSLVNIGPANPGLAKSGQAKSYPANPGPAKPGQAKPCPANPGLAEPSLANIDPANPSLTKPSLAKPCTGKPTEAKAYPAKPGQAKHCPANPAQSKPCPANPGFAEPSLANIDPANPSLTEPSLAKPGSGQPAEAKSYPANPGLVKPGVANPCPAKPGQAKRCPNNPAQAKPCPANSDLAEPSLANIDPANPNLTMPSLANPGLAQPAQAKPYQANSGLAKPGLSNPCPAKPGQAKPCPANPGQPKPGDPARPEICKPSLPDSGPAKPCPAKPEIAKPGPVKTNPPKPGQTKPGQFKHSQVNPSPAKPGPAKPGPAKPGPAKPDPAKPGPAKHNQAKPAPNKPMSKWQPIKQKQKKASTENLRQLQSNEIKESAETDKKSQMSNEENSKNRKIKETEENNCSSVKVTAITIVTSLNELIAHSLGNETDKTTSNDPEAVLIQNIKKEIDFENLDKEKIDSTTEPTDSDKAPRVTSITIMTSTAELYSLSHEEAGDKNYEIKSENVDFDAELSEDIHIIDSNKETEPVEQNNSVIKELEQVIANSETQHIPEDKMPMEDEEDETIESIVKYVASLL